MPDQPPVAVPGPASVSPADTPSPDDLREAAEHVVTYDDTATAANWLRSAADRIGELLDDRAALLAVGERDKAEASAHTSLRVELANIFGPVKPREGQTWNEAMLIRITETLVAEGEKAGERDRRQIAQLTEALGELTDAGCEHVAGHDEPGDLEAAVQKAARVLSPLSPESGTPLPTPFCPASVPFLLTRRTRGHE